MKIFKSNLDKFNSYIDNNEDYKNHKDLYNEIYKVYIKKIQIDKIDINIEISRLEKKLNRNNSVVVAVAILTLSVLLDILIDYFKDYLSKFIPIWLVYILLVVAVLWIFISINKDDNYEWTTTALHVLKDIEKNQNCSKENNRKLNSKNRNKK